MGALPLFVLVAAAGVVAGHLRGGNVEGLRETEVRGRTLALVCLLVQAVIGAPLLRDVGLPRVLGAVVLIVALVALVGVARANGRLPGVPLLALGLLLCLLVTLVNLGVPVSEATLRRGNVAVEEPVPHRPDLEHVLEGPATRIAVLGDRLAVPPLWTVTGVGEVAEFAGLFLLLQHMMLMGAVPGRRRSARADDAHEAKTIPWSAWGD
jgi:hypothetical protein